MPSFTALATKVYKDPLTVQWMNSVKTNDDYFFTGVAKGYVQFRGNATSGVEISASFNVASVVRNSAGRYTITWTSGFNQTAYAVAGISRGMTFDYCSMSQSTMNSGSINVRNYRTDTAAAEDVTGCTILAFGPTP